MGKLVAAFVFFLAASTLAIRETRPLAPPPPTAADDAVTAPLHGDAATHGAPTIERAPSRAIRDEVPPWVKYAPPPPQPKRVITVTSSIIVFDDDGRDSNGDVPDIVDRCPDQPTDGDDNDGCPEPDSGPRIID